MNWDNSCKEINYVNTQQPFNKYFIFQLPFIYETF
jgi:hypothetical protein